ncbi:long-chain-acyl-CoA dehydrogenase [Jatrophihabitans endophyticus]|uniref:Long-chain-acyl-CoA dehydrogenase n=1 Tax=Jatrophihabitans endophyticus TaxID=1206085 RepID=A0A1M5Q1K1_9ACTN|nr:acyl-CoA dehydrogenase family protein [Jatrophihabitans endophyticus]SHH07796.1 long-chain-acyl-CoA dehydrogenase [Jatrophihabitans endophyticus]
MQRHLYEPDHDAYREAVREFVDREVVGNVEHWEEQRLIDRSVWMAAGKQGVIGLSAPEEFGGAGQLRDYRFRNVVMEELSRVGATGLASSFSLQDDIAIPYIASLGTPEQRERWLPRMVSGELIGAIAMTEPGTGSDLRGIRTAAVATDGGWRVSGAKTFITSGIQSDLVIVVARTGAPGERSAHSLLVVEEGMAGFSRGRKLRKMGLHSQDTAELFFDDVFVPTENLLGELGGGLDQLKKHLPLERLSIAAAAVAGSTAVLDATLAYVREREAFGQRIADFQNTRFVLAEVATELDVTRSYVDDVIRAWNDGTLTVVDAAKAKWWASEVQNRLVDRCLQLFGGYGWMEEYPVSRAYQDARIQKIFGGTNEIMKEIIGRDLVGKR